MASTGKARASGRGGTYSHLSSFAPRALIAPRPALLPRPAFKPPRIVESSTNYPSPMAISIYEISQNYFLGERARCLTPFKFGT